MINYSPFDVVYKLCKFAPVRLLARAMDQLHVTHHIHHGVNYALKHYTAAYLIAVLVGIAKGLSVHSTQLVLSVYVGSPYVLQSVTFFGSRPSDHYFRSVCLSVCLFVCLFVCAEFFSAVFHPISIKLGHMLYVWV